MTEDNRPAMRAHMLYRFYDADDVLLYVGMTMNPGQRWANHRDEKAWWADVATVRTQLFDSREAVLEAETKAIQAEHPLHNVVHNRRTQAARPRPVVSDRVTWRCDLCDQPVADNDGYIYLPTDPCEVEKAWREFNARTTGADGVRVITGDTWKDYFAMPLANWGVLHRGCDPEPDAEPYYWFGVEAANTRQKLLDWAAHLFPNSWLRSTNWDALLYRGNGGAL